MTEKAQKRMVFGYNRNVFNLFEINQAQALAVKLLFELYADGDSMQAISTKLELCNIPSPYNNAKWESKRLQKFYHTSVMLEMMITHR